MELDIERVHALADKMAGAVGTVRADELVMAGMELAVRALRLGGRSERAALRDIEMLARQLQAEAGS